MSSTLGQVVRRLTTGSSGDQGLKALVSVRQFLIEELHHRTHGLNALTHSSGKSNVTSRIKNVSVAPAAIR
jgi:hypothetical protein